MNCQVDLPGGEHYNSALGLHFPSTHEHSISAVQDDSSVPSQCGTALRGPAVPFSEGVGDLAVHFCSLSCQVHHWWLLQSSDAVNITQAHLTNSFTIKNYVGWRKNNPIQFHGKRWYKIFEHSSNFALGFVVITDENFKLNCIQILFFPNCCSMHTPALVLLVFENQKHSCPFWQESWSFKR